MVFINKRGTARTDHDHTFAIHNVGADLQRRVCGECGQISIDPTEPTSLRSEVNIDKAGLFRAAPEFVYELAEALALIPATDPDRPRFEKRRKAKAR